MVLLFASCTFVSRGSVVVGGNDTNSTHRVTDDEVALVIAPVLERHGLQAAWSWKKANGPCTAARGCSWALDNGMQPWVLVASLSSGQVKVSIEARHDMPGPDSRIRNLTKDVAKALRAHFGSDHVVIEREN